MGPPDYEFTTFEFEGEWYVIKTPLNKQKIAELVYERYKDWLKKDKLERIINWILHGDPGHPLGLPRLKDEA